MHVFSLNRTPNIKVNKFENIHISELNRTYRLGLPVRSVKIVFESVPTFQTRN
jgi:hypothetical protein